MSLDSDKIYGAYKNRRKVVRFINETLILLICLCVLILALTTGQEYVPYTAAAVTGQDNGFITVSYFGTDIQGDETHISAQRLEDHLTALRESGYVTITQQDILDYYEKGKKLPERALFLMFEDGRRDTAIFTEKILEKLNQKATVLTYADKFGKKDDKFLSPGELLELKKESYWEMGSNGYRLAYINTFDRYGNYFGQLNSIEFNRLSKYVDRNYNHYLMDYIRDEFEIPLESHAEMKARIQAEYAYMQDIYTKELGEVPGLYILMHSNTGMFATNDKASSVNEKEIYETFRMNFNREGYCLNTADISRYDLTRMQPQAYWPTNHLLMRIWDDTGLTQAFREGTQEIAAQWEVLEGVAECTAQRITLTTLPNARGLMRLKGSEGQKNLNLSVQLKGNKLGSQSIYLRADETLESCVAVRIENNVLLISQKAGGAETTLFTLDLDVFDGTVWQTKEENRLESQQAAIEAKRIYGEKTAENRRILEMLRQDEAGAVSQAGKGDYIPELELKTSGNRLMDIALLGNQLKVSIDQKEAASLTLSGEQSGMVYLEARAILQDAYSQRNLADDVYDGVFETLTIFTDGEAENALYDTRPKGWDAFTTQVGNGWQSLVEWFIKTV
ncbi:MAG: glycoside hydrolase [Candidatus Pelethousia sp.]|nr:glycoside hydrolase [Candidatus Pelethousia sp.]